MVPSHSRRRFLAAGAATGLAATAGCVRFGDPWPSHGHAAGDAGSRTDWPALAHDAANTGFAPDGRGPTGSVGERWSVELEAFPRAAPVVAGNSVLQVDGDALRCLRVADGAERWRFGVDRTTLHPPAVGGWTAEADASAMDTVYLADASGVVHALSFADGAERWRFEAAGDLGAPPTVTAEGRYLLAGTERGVVHALELTEDGERRDEPREAWRADVFGNVQRPIATPRSGLTAYVATQGGDVYALSVEDGTEHWREDLSGRINTAPAAVEDHVYVGCTDGRVHALDGFQGGAPRWHSETGGRVRPWLAVFDHTVFGVDDGRVVALALHGGEERWSVDLGANVGTAPSVAGDALYVGDYDGRLHALDAYGGVGVGPLDLGVSRWTYDVGQPIAHGVVVTDGVCYVVTEGRDEASALYAIEGE